MGDDASIVFDRAAEFYDQTRSLPPGIQTQVADLLFDELSGRGVCLEPGVGTGRMSLPLHKRGIPIVGVDLSLPMMQRLVDNAGGSAPFPLLRTDVTALPFSDGAFGAAFLCHVLHLIPRWRDAVSELARVVRPGGVIVVDLGGGAMRASKEVNREFARQSGQEQNMRPGVTNPADLDDAMAILGAPLQRTRSIPVLQTYTIDEVLARLESNQFSSTWRLDEATRVRAAAATRTWAEQHFGDVHAPRTEDAEIVWRVYERG